MRRLFGSKSGLAIVLSVLAIGTSAGGSSAAQKSVATPSSAKQTISFAESGLGTEGAQTAVAIKAFEKANPNIKVTTDVLSSDSTTYLQQLEQRFIAGSSTPDVLESDVTYPAKFAQAGWIKPLSSLKPNLKQFFAAEVAAGTFKGTAYALPWFDNPEGLFYRTDLVSSPPTSPAQVVSDAEAAMKKDPSLKEGLAFEGAKYEGAITALMTVDSAFGGKLTTTKIGSAGNVAALKWLHDAIYVNHIAPQAVTGWQEGQVQQEFTSGNAAFAITTPSSSQWRLWWPSKGPRRLHPLPGRSWWHARRRTRWRDARDQRQDDARSGGMEAHAVPHEFVSRGRQGDRDGDPPSLPSAYTSALYAKAPYFKAVKTLNGFAQPRPVTPNYLQVSSDLQTALSSVFANQSSASSALTSAASQIAADTSSTK